MEKVAHFFADKTPSSTWISGILLLASFLRLYRIQDYLTFLGDEGRDVLVVYKILHGQPTLLGPTASVGGFFLGPIYYYLMTPFLWLSNYNPVGPAVMVAFFGVATVFLVYKIGSEFFNKGVGLITAFLYSISPLVIAHSRSSWNPNLMPFFSLLTLYILYKAISKNSLKLFIFCGILLGITMQIHYLATFLGVIIAIYVLLSRSILVQGYSLQKTIVRALKDYFYILVGFIIGWSPFLAFEVRHGFPNIQSILSFVFSSKDAGANNHFFQTIYDVFFRLFGRLVTYFPPPEQVAIDAHKNITLWYYATLALGIASLVAVLRSRNNPARTLLMTWFILGVGLFGFYKKSIYDYYFGFMFPLPFILVGIFLSSLYKTRIGKILTISIFVGLTLINLKGIPFQFIPNRQLAQVEGISKFVIEKTDNKPFNFALITGGNSDHAYRYFFTVWGKSPITIENPKKDPERKTVANQLLIVCEVNPCHPLGNSLWEVAGFGRGEIESQWDVSVVKVYKLRHYKGN
ncbi:MAG: glycosyltransferase family 39 protein [Patescibacteria group bacterium]